MHPTHTESLIERRATYISVRDAGPDKMRRVFWRGVQTTVERIGALARSSPTRRSVEFETVDAMRVQDGKIV